MAHPVLALGTALATASGCVWYLPALSEVRAGADRPDSRRSTAAACLSGWSTAGCVALLLLLTEAWHWPAAAASAGAAVTAGALVRAAVQHRREARETARDWAGLGLEPHRAPALRPLLAALLVAVLAAAAATAVLLAAGPGKGSWAVVTLPTALLGLFLTAVTVRACATRRRRRAGGGGPAPATAPGAR
ncbi:MULTISPECIES: hypothetical protein [unclassified Streptomyces]|uniref:hypothetical protein n=1 Tax=unclassified Streptomyces TaxID=2593676 RepID=UPI0022387BB8|nr:hypothetical protein [Streptomyces sp. SHP 1-2]MCW5249602.1 hypothetical protein [Streptomyces sp. SHP 1-2]